MGLFDKFKRKSDKSKLKEKKKLPSKDLKVEKKKIEPEDKKDLTLAELKEKETRVKGHEALKVAEKKIAKKATKDDTKRAYQVLLKPMITEKGTYLASESKYIFEVKGEANKIEIKKAIEAVYGVSPVKVNIVKLPGKSIRYGRVRGRTKDRKKAVVTLKQGETIEVYEGV